MKNFRITFQKVENTRPKVKEITAKNLVDVYHKLEEEKLGVIKEIKEV